TIEARLPLFCIALFFSHCPSSSYIWFGDGVHAPNLILVAFHIADVTVDPAYLEGEPIFVAAVELGGFRTILNVPILKEDELIGVFAIYRQEVRSFSSRQVE